MLWRVCGGQTPAGDQLSLLTRGPWEPLPLSIRVLSSGLLPGLTVRFQIQSISQETQKLHFKTEAVL